jgi:hypothetical protein
MDSNGKEMLRPVCGTVRSRRTVLLGRELRVPPRRVRHDGVRRTVAPRAVRGTEELHRNARTGHPAGGVVPRRTHKQHHDNTGRDDAHIGRRTRRTRSHRAGVVPASYPRRTRRRTPYLPNNKPALGPVGNSLDDLEAPFGGSAA